MQTSTEGLHHRGASSDNDSTLKTTSQVNITSLDAVGHKFVDTWVFETNQTRTEENLRGACLVSIANVNFRTVGQQVVIGIVLSRSVLLLHGTAHIGSTLTLLKLVSC